MRLKGISGALGNRATTDHEREIIKLNQLPNDSVVVPNVDGLVAATHDRERALI